MKISRKFFISFCFAIIFSNNLFGNNFSSLTEWSKACAKKPESAEKTFDAKTDFIRQTQIPVTLQTKSLSTSSVISQQEFEKTMAKFVQGFNENNYYNSQLWLGKTPEKSLFEKFPESLPKENSNLHVQKLYLSNPAASTICFIGDIHGSIHSLLRNLLRLKELGYLSDDFKIIKNNFFIVFNGDFVDRGQYGIEVWYTLMLLKLNNWDKIFLLRGNHETWSISYLYGLSLESKYKFGEEDGKKIFDSIVALYELLPLALYLGPGKGDKETEWFVQCSHGGIEIGYNPNKLLTTPKKVFEKLEEFDQQYFDTVKDFCSKTAIAATQEKPYCFRGLNWSDFIQTKDSTIWYNEIRGAGYEADVAATNKYLTKTPLIKAFIRGHQDREFGFKMLFSIDDFDIGKVNSSLYPNGPWHWIYVKEEYDQINPFGFRMYNSAYTDHAPVFTSTTATEGQSVPFDFLLLLFTDEKYQNWRLKPYEFALSEDRFQDKNDIFLAWQDFIKKNFKDMKQHEKKFEATLEARIKELEAKTDAIGEKKLKNAQDELVWYRKKTGTEAPKETAKDDEAGKKTIKKLTDALAKLKNSLETLGSTLLESK